MAIVVVLWIVMSRVRRRPGNRDTLDPRRWGRRELVQEESALSNKEDELEIRLHERSREILARIDSKLVLLQELIGRAETAAARLEQALAAAAAQRQTASLVATSAEGNVPADASIALEQPVSAASGGNDARTPEQAGTQVGGTAVSERVEEEVRSLATYGFSALEISQQMGLAEATVRNILTRTN